MNSSINSWTRLLSVLSRISSASLLSAAFTLTCSMTLSSAASAYLADWTPESRALTLNGSNLVRTGNAEAGLANLRQAVAISPNSWDVNYNIGVALEVLKRYAEAQQWFQKAYSLDPSRHLALLGLGRIFFDQKDYARALPILEQMASEHEDKEVAYSVLLSLARCYAETGRIKDFGPVMARVFAIKSNDPASWRFAGQEMDFVKQYDEAEKYYREYLKRFPNASDSAAIAERLNIVSFDKLEIEELKSVQDGFPLTSDTEDLRDFVQVIETPKSKVSKQAVARVMLGLSQLPRTYRHQLETAGYKVVVAPTVLDAMPQLAGAAPRGYADGANWHNSNGAFDRQRKTIVVGEFCNALSMGGKEVEGELDETVQHEFGHAYDMFLGTNKVGADKTDPFPDISHSKRFGEAYDRDARVVPADLRQKLAYYLAPGNAGKEELFAQMFVLIFGHRPEPGSPRESFKAVFPHVLEAMYDARKSDPDYLRLQAIFDAKFQDNTLTPAERVQKLLKQN